MGFVMDPPETISCLEDTSFTIMKEACRRAHEVFYLDSRFISARQNRVYAEASTVDANDRDGFRETGKFPSLDLESLDVIFLRKDPPFDSGYLSLTYLLGLLKGKVPVVNDPEGVRNANEKLSVLAFPDRIPQTVVSSRASEILGFLEEMREIVLKPLWQRGGVGIVKIGPEDPGREKIVEEMLRVQGTVIAQRFLPEVRSEGDKRILLLDGRPLGAYRRKPPPGDFRVSLYRDGRYEAASLSSGDEALVLALRDFLAAQGLYFVGLDVIGGFLTEINVTSPGGIPEINHFAGRKLETAVVDFLEGQCRSGIV